MLAICVLCGVLSLRIWRRAAQDGMTVVELTHAIVGQLLINTFHQQTRVAAFDIGRMVTFTVAVSQTLGVGRTVHSCPT